MFLIYGIYFSVGAIFCAVSVGHEPRQFCKITAITFTLRYTSAIVHFVQPNLSGRTEVDANPVVMCAFHTDFIMIRFMYTDLYRCNKIKC